MFITGIVLAAGASRRLGEPKQLLPFRGSTLLGSTLSRARACGFDQLLVTLGGAAAQVRAHVDLAGADIVENPEFSTGCGSSIRTAVGRVDARADGVVLLLGDQPDISVEVVERLIAAAGGSPVAVCRYRDRLGHPFWFSRDVFGALGRLHGDKAIWKLLDAGAYHVLELAVEGDVPRDVDTWADYEALVGLDPASDMR